MAKQIHVPVVPILYPQSLAENSAMDRGFYVVPQPIMEFKELVPDFARWEEWQAWLKRETRKEWLAKVRRDARRQVK